MPETRSQKSLMYGAVSIVSTLFAFVLIGFAVFGLSHRQPGEIIWFVGMIAMMVIRIPHGAKNKNNEIVGSRKDVGEKALLTGMFITMNVLPLLHLATPAFVFADYTLPSSAIILGALIQVPFLLMFWRSHKDLGKNWSAGLEVHEQHTLVTSGVYATIRHPMYTALWLSALAQPLLIQNWVAGLMVLPAFAALYFIRVPREEAMMREIFGAEYDAYIGKTGRIIPKFNNETSQ